MSSGFEGAGWLWRFMDREDGPGMWHHTDNAEHAELLGRRLSVEVRELAFADDVRQLAEQRAELLEALRYARRFLNADDNDTAYVDAAIALAQGDAA